MCSLTVVGINRMHSSCDFTGPDLSGGTCHGRQVSRGSKISSGYKNQIALDIIVANYRESCLSQL